MSDARVREAERVYLRCPCVSHFVRLEWIDTSSVTDTLRGHARFLARAKDLVRQQRRARLHNQARASAQFFSALSVSMGEAAEALGRLHEVYPALSRIHDEIVLNISRRDEPEA